MESIYLEKSYKSYLKALAKGSRGLLTSLARAAYCELSYLSRVLSTEAHITPDQAYNIALKLNLNTREREYFLLMVDYERAGEPKFRSYLESKMEKIRLENENLSLRTERNVAAFDQKEMIYHSSWIYCAVHIATSIQELQSIDALSRKFNLSAELIEEVLRFLVAHDFVQYEKSGRYVFKNVPTYTPKDSVLVPIHHNSWRQKAYQDSLQFQKDSLHYTMVQSVSRADFVRIKNLVLKTIDDYEKIASPSDCEELINFNIDVYRV